MRKHYVDISGDEATFRELKEWHSVATNDAQVALVPGAALTVLGSDALLRWALQVGATSRMAEPHSVRIALSRVPAISRGSARTMLDSVREGVTIRRAGKAVTVPVGSLVRAFAFGSEGDFACADSRLCTAMTLADSQAVEQAAQHELKLPHDFRVPNVETYVEASALEQMTYEVAGEFALALRSWPFKQSIDYALGFWPEGPRSDERDNSRQQVVVEVEDRYRRCVEARLSTPNSYEFSVRAALATAIKLSNHTGMRGFLSPAHVLGKLDIHLLLQGCRGRLRTQGFRQNLADVPQDWST